jgi:hypothetical protein
MREDYDGKHNDAQRELHSSSQAIRSVSRTAADQLLFFSVCLRGVGLAISDPRLIVRDQEGKLYRVRYDAVNAMLLNKFELINSYCVCSERFGSKFHQS